MTIEAPRRHDAGEMPPIQSGRHSEAWCDLSSFSNHWYDPGRGLLVRTLWYFLSLLVLESGWFPLSTPKAWLLRLFGAKVGSGLVVKPHVRIKYPWRLRVGDHCWIGEDVWIDNLDDVVLGDDVCVSQGVYFCTGSHDYRRRTFDLIIRPIELDNGVWIGAKAVLLPGVRVGANSLVAAAATVTKDVPPKAIAAGCPARVIGMRNPPTQMEA